MVHYGSLEERINQSLNSLSPKYKRIANFILSNRYFASFASTSQIADKVDTSSATVVRFAQTLDYEGYPELREAIRAELPKYNTAAKKMEKRISSNQALSTTPQQVFYTDVQNIEQTRNNLSEEHLNDALDAIIKARHILVIGSGLSSSLVVFLTHSLSVMGFTTLELHGESLQSVVKLSQMQPNDLLIAIDLWRYARVTVNAVTMAKGLGVPTIAITDNFVSPLARLANQAFEIATEGVAHSLSITAAMSLINVIIAMLADRVPQQVVESLKNVDNAYRNNNLLIIK